MKIDKNKLCPLCENKYFRNLYDFNEYIILNCNKCGLAVTEIKEDINASIKEEYKEDYYSEHPRYRNLTEENIINHKLTKRHKKLLLKIEQYKSKEKRLGKLLDIGCANGGFLSICNSNGWDTHGVEKSSYASNYARECFGLKVITGDVEDVEVSERSFDVITMLEVIEHVDDPVLVLQKVDKLLKDDGILVFTTINVDSLVTYIACFVYYVSLGLIKWPLEECYQSQHMVHFGEKHIGPLLEKTGFEIVYKEKIEIPLSMLKKGKLTRIILNIIYFFAYLTHLQYEILVIAKKSQKPNIEE